MRMSLYHISSMGWEDVSLDRVGRGEKFWGNSEFDAHNMAGSLRLSVENSVNRPLINKKTLVIVD